MSNNIESILNEQRVFNPSENFKAQANVNAEQYSALLKKADEDYEGFWAGLAKEKLTW